MSNTQIREAQKGDYSAICALINNELGDPDVRLDELAARMEIMDRDQNYRTFVALLDGKIVGFIGTVQGIAFEVNGGYLRIMALAVAKEYQRGGIGGALLTHAETFAAARGITAFALNSGLRRLDAHLFYERNGYQKKSYGFGKG